MELFAYANNTGSEYENTQKVINCVRFCISRFRRYQICHYFEGRATVAEAVAYVEQYLSQPLTKQYYEMIHDDNFDSETSWDDHMLDWNRGELLSAAVILEKCQIQAGELTFSIGS